MFTIIADSYDKCITLIEEPWNTPFSISKDNDIIFLNFTSKVLFAIINVVYEYKVIRYNN